MLDFYTCFSSNTSCPIFQQISANCSSSRIHNDAARDKVNSPESSDVEESDNIIDLENEDMGFSGDWSGDEQYARLQSHLDNFNIPPGIEVAVPWFSNDEVNNLGRSNSTTNFNSDIQLNWNHLGKAPLNQSTEPEALSYPPDESGSVQLSTELEDPNATSHRKKCSDRKKKYTRSDRKFWSGSKYKSSSSSTVANDGHKAMTTAFGRVCELLLGLASDGKGGMGMVTKDNDSSVKFQVIPFPSVSDSYEPSFTTSASSSCMIVYEDPEVSLKRFDLFKRFDTVEDDTDHLFSDRASVNMPSKDWAKKIQNEWRILEKDLPDTIFVRMYESRMDLLRAVIIGAEGTPYHDGLFFFDMFFPPNYPNIPPEVKYHSGGLRINPNLYNCGKVCLSLLNTWSGDKQEMWTPGVSTVLQILVSIQGLILNAKPYFNEPGYSGSSGTRSGEIASMQYNERTLIYSLKTMAYSIRNPPKHFEDFIAGHFLKRADDIFVSCKAYLNGAQVGCLVKGGIQDIEAGGKSCSDEFKKELAKYLKTLVNALAHVGVKDCDKFLAEIESLPKLQVTKQGCGFWH